MRATYLSYGLKLLLKMRLSMLDWLISTPLISPLSLSIVVTLMVSIAEPYNPLHQQVLFIHHKQFLMRCLLSTPPLFSIHSLLTPPLPRIHISEEEVVKTLRSFPNGSVPGPSGLQANYLKEAVFCPSPDRASLVLHSLL